MFQAETTHSSQILEYSLRWILANWRIEIALKICLILLSFSIYQTINFVIIHTPQLALVV